MPKRPSQGVKNVNVELPPDLIEKVLALAEKNGRPFREEVEAAAPPPEGAADGPGGRGRPAAARGVSGRAGRRAAADAPPAGRVT